MEIYVKVRSGEVVVNFVPSTEKVRSGQVLVNFVSSTEQFSDILTKPLT